jgi:deoxyuridine 5'-triphosphate nucleotidohydrolase
MIEFIKIRDVKDPERNVNENAGIDFYIPELTEDVAKKILEFNHYLSIKDNTIYISPHEDILIPSGIKAKFDKNIAMVVSNKSGIATKKKLIHGAHIIDSSYEGEWMFHLINWSNQTQTLDFGTRVVQVVPIIISNEQHIMKDCSEEEFFKIKSERGQGGFGSTGIN